MDKFSIRDIELLTGIKAHTIRIWEQRYTLFEPKRKETNHRYYDCEDLKKILRVANLYNRGYKISKIAHMSDSEICELAFHVNQETDLYSIHVNELLEASMDLDHDKFEKVFNTVLLRLGLEQCILKVIYPFLIKIGIFWSTSNILPAQEHFSSNIIRKKLLVAIDGLIHISSSKDSYLLFLPEGELHEIPLLFAHYLLKKKGYTVINFGANVPLQDLDFVVEKTRCSHIYTHMITNFTGNSVEAFIKELSGRFPKTRIVVSGPQVQYVHHQAPGNVTLLTSQDELIRYLCS